MMSKLAITEPAVTVLDEYGYRRFYHMEGFMWWMELTYTPALRLLAADPNTDLGITTTDTSGENLTAL